MIKFIAFLCLATCISVGTTELNSSPKEGRLINAYPASINSFPYQVSLAYDGQYICGGSIIGTRVVLTAASCAGYSVSLYTVRAGTSYQNLGGIVYKVTAITKHPNYNEDTHDYDVAILHISSSFVFTTGVRAVGLPTQGSSPSAGVAAIVAGWDSNGVSSTLQYLTIPIVGNAQCKSYYGDAITARMICAGYLSGEGVCDGDIGSALVSGTVQVGVVSWGVGCGSTNYPSVYTNVGSVRNWITAVIGV